MPQINYSDTIKRDLEESWRIALRAEQGDSNDEEIAAWRSLAEEALGHLRITEPDLED